MSLLLLLLLLFVLDEYCFWYCLTFCFFSVTFCLLYCFAFSMLLLLLSLLMFAFTYYYKHQHTARNSDNSIYTKKRNKSTQRKTQRNITLIHSVHKLVTLIFFANCVLTTCILSTLGPIKTEHLSSTGFAHKCNTIPRKMRRCSVLWLYCVMACSF